MTTEKNTHILLPWLLNPDGSIRCQSKKYFDIPVPLVSCFIEDAFQPSARGFPEAFANAELIVRAVNNHEALVTALRKLRAEYHAALLVSGENPEFADIACEEADAVLAEAEIT